MCYQLWVSSFEMLKSILLYISYMLLLRGKRIIAKKLEAIETKCKTIGWEMRNMMDYDGIWYVSKQDSTWIDLDLAVSVWFSDSVWCLAWLACLAWDLWDLWVAGCGEPPMAALPAAMSPAATHGATGTSAASALGSVGSSSCSLWASQISTTWMLKNVEKFNLQNEAFTKTFSLKIGKKCCRERK